MGSRLPPSSSVLLALFGLACSGCSKKVPEEIVQQSLKGAFARHSPQTTSAMCGTKVLGLVDPAITVKERRSDGTGVAHVRGAPRPSSPSPSTSPSAAAPAFCEGDVEFKFSSTSKTTARKDTTTTWYLEHVKLVAIQTPGVKGATVDEDPDGDD